MIRTQTTSASSSQVCS